MSNLTTGTVSRVRVSRSRSVWMRYLDAARRLTVLGCVELPRRAGGSHRKWYNPQTSRASVLPDHGSKDLKTGTLRAAVKQLGIEWERFERS